MTIEDVLESVREPLARIEDLLRDLEKPSRNLELLDYMIDEQIEQAFGYLEELDKLIKQKIESERIR